MNHYSENNGPQTPAKNAKKSQGVEIKAVPEVP